MSMKYKICCVFILLSICINNAIGQDDVLDADKVLNSLNVSSPEAQKKLDAAFAAMEAVRKAGAYIESLKDLFEDGIITLPVGIKKGDYELIIQSIKKDNDTQQIRIYATCAFKFKENGQQIAFEGWSTIEGKKGLGGGGELKLITPVGRDKGKDITIVFEKGTGVHFGCDGIEGFNAKLAVICKSDKLKPVDSSGKVIDRKIGFRAEASFSNFDEFSVTIGSTQAFMHEDIKDVVFNIKGVTVDQSDLTTSSMLKFPSNYFNGEIKGAKELWKGIAFNDITIYLPPIIKKQNKSNKKKPENDKAPIGSEIVTLKDRVTIGANYLLLDENGISVSAFGNNIMDISSINKESWDINITDFSLDVVKNEIVGIGFGGALNVPPLGKSSLLNYTASYDDLEKIYDFKAQLTDDLELELFKANLTLNKSSFIDVVIKKQRFYPTLNLSGKLSINVPIDDKDSTKKFNVPDITFQNLVIRRESPKFKIGAIGVAGALSTPSLGGFELCLNNIQSFKKENDEGIRFDAGIKLSSTLSGVAGIQLFGDAERWKFRKIGIDKVAVDFKSSAYSIAGGVEFKNGDKIYGSGFRGDVKLTVLNKFGLDAIAVFGKKDDYRYFLTDVLYEAAPSSGIPATALSFYGLGGGLYRHMQQSVSTSAKTEFGKARSGIHYIPDRDVGMGFMAAAKFCLGGSPSTLDAQAGFEIQFNKNGGVNFVQLRADAYFLTKPENSPSLTAELKKKVTASKETGIKPLGDVRLRIPENVTSSLLAASMNIKYDLQNDVFNADMSTFLNAGFSKGIGEKGRMGWASAYFSPDKWYTYIGTPTDRLGIKVLNLAEMNGYFMLGDDIPELPDPPAKVLENLSSSVVARLCKRDNSSLQSGRGIAFGASFNAKFDATLPPFYAHIGAGVGAEFLLKNYGSRAHCEGSNKALGFAGWYAQAQAWAWVEADIGMRLKLFGKKKSFSILGISAAAVLRGTGPNPFYFTGAVGGEFEVMGGLISGKCDFDFEIGDECKIKGKSSPFGESVIAQVTPDGGKNINVFTVPQVVFNIPIDLEMKTEEDDGTKSAYKVNLDEFSVYYKDTKQKVEGKMTIAEEGKVYAFDPNEPLESHKNIEVIVAVSFMKKENNQWVAVKGDDGKLMVERKVAAFVSGERPKMILPEHVVYSYPIDRQYNYYSHEVNYGYICTSENYNYLFTTEKLEGYTQYIRLTDEDNKQQKVSFKTLVQQGEGNSCFEINFSTDKIDFKTDHVYHLEVVNIADSTSVNVASNVKSETRNHESLVVTTQKADGSIKKLDDKVIYALDFRSSKSRTFKDKMNNIKRGETLKIPLRPYVSSIVTNLREKDAAEGFDRFEFDNIQPEKSLIKFQANYESKWYKDNAGRLLYNNKQVKEILGQNDLTPPQPYDIVELRRMTTNIALTDGFLKSGTLTYISAYNAFYLQLAHHLQINYKRLRNDFTNRLNSYKNTPKISRATLDFMKISKVEEITRGTYKFKMSYNLPGKQIPTSYITETITLK